LNLAASSDDPLQPAQTSGNNLHAIGQKWEWALFTTGGAINLQKHFTNFSFQQVMALIPSLMFCKCLPLTHTQFWGAYLVFWLLREVV
jgi:hypothetical protein